MPKGKIFSQAEIQRGDVAGAAIQETRRQYRVLTVVKVIHTAVWAFFAGCIAALPFAGWVGRFDWVLILTAFILGECGVLALNRGKCPLTSIAGRYTADRSAAFDIYLPEWLAARNKAIFGTMFVVNEVIVLWLWRR
jgi:hypothetical protein